MRVIIARNLKSVTNAVRVIGGITVIIVNSVMSVSHVKSGLQLL